MADNALLNAFRGIAAIELSENIMGHYLMCKIHERKIKIYM